VTGYADVGTGNPKIDLGYSQGRAQNVAKALTDAGIDASRITVDAKGDTVQPFSENDKNRVTIAIAE
jgi:outer membrane protein OmpA-like peptidoglycan-associated protein